MTAESARDRPRGRRATDLRSVLPRVARGGRVADDGHDPVLVGTPADEDLSLDRDLSLDAVLRGEAPAGLAAIGAHGRGDPLAPAADDWLRGRPAGERTWAAQDLQRVPPGGARAAIARLLLAHAGLEPAHEAWREGRDTLRHGPVGDAAARGLLLTLVGAAESWLGRQEGAARTLNAAALGARSAGHRMLLSRALAQLAVAEHAQGNSRAAAGVAARSVRAAGGLDPAARWLAVDAADLALLHLDPWHRRPPPATSEPGFDLADRFWRHLADAADLTLRGRPRAALDLLEVGPELPEPPAALARSHAVARAVVAVVAEDRRSAASARVELGDHDHDDGADVALVDGLVLMLRGDLPRATAALQRAAEGDGVAQPDSESLARVALSQLLAANGDDRGAAIHLEHALDRCERNGDALPFVGWFGRTVPVHALLARFVGPGASAWRRRLRDDAVAHGSLSVRVALVCATEREASSAVTPALVPLTGRERDVLHHLARGATYADVAATLCVSTNTVKTHVTSLYAKLGVRRRSDALATARSSGLL